MIGILVIAHKPVASSFGMAARHVLGSTPPYLSWLDVDSDDDPGTVLQRARSLVEHVDTGAGVLVFSDICGATPCNVATELIQHGKVAVISGLNLPMLLRAINYRDASLEDSAQKALAGGTGGVMRMERGNAAK
jgi:mannose PTS system EIIA component